MKYFWSVLLLILSGEAANSQSIPALIWYQNYGDPQYNQFTSAQAIDNSDNFYVAGSVYFGTYGNVITNKYDAFGNLKWNRLYNNTFPSPYPDGVLLIHPRADEQLAVVGYLHRQFTLGHIFYYDVNGNLSGDYFFGDSTLGNTLPVQVSTNDDGQTYYLLGALNGFSEAFKIDTAGDVLWSQPLYNNYNTNAGSIAFDPAGNMVAGVFDSATSNVMIRRFDANSGSPLFSFNTRVDSVLEDTVIDIKVDRQGDVFLAGTGLDSAGRLQMKVYKFDSLGHNLWSSYCLNPRGYYTNSQTRLRLDPYGDVVIDGTYNDNNDSLQFAGLFKLSNDSGTVLWWAVDTGAVVSGGALKADSNDVYLGTLKGNSIASGYSLINFTGWSADSGQLVWIRGFANSDDNITIADVQNPAGDLFIDCTTLTDSVQGWFMARLGNAANDVMGINNLIKEENNMQVYPNPFSGTTYISFTLAESQKLQLEVFDIRGQLLNEMKLHANEGSNGFTYNNPLVPGVYFFMMKGEDFDCVRKVVVE